MHIKEFKVIKFHSYNKNFLIQLLFKTRKKNKGCDTQFIQKMPVHF